MNCPVCNTELRTADRLGVEIDHCPRCRGVWLDRGELDKLLERANTLSPTGSDDYAWRPEGGAPQRSDPPYHPKKRESFWQRVFDFD